MTAAMSFMSAECLTLYASEAHLPIALASAVKSVSTHAVYP
jgi:hypothetical protein